MRLQCFLPTRYVKNEEYPWYALFRNFLKLEYNIIGCFLALYGSTVHPRCIMWFSGQFLFAA